VRYLAHLLRQTKLAELPEGAKVLTVSYKTLQQQRKVPMF